MKTIIVAAVLALAFTTGFTCSKNTPAESTETTVPAQEEMAAPAEGAPTEGAPADGATDTTAPANQ